MKKICPKGKHWVEIRGIKNGGYCRKSRGRRHPFAEKLRQPLENGLKDPSGGLKEQLGSAGITGAVLGALGGAVATAMLLTPKGSETAFRNGQMEAANEFAKKETELRSQLAEEIGKAKQEYAAKGVDVEAVNQKLTAEQERMKQRAASLEQELAGLKAIEGTLAKATAEKSALSKELEEAKKTLEAVMKAPAGGQTQGAVELSAKLPGLDQQVKDRDATIADLKQKLKKAEEELVARVPHIAIERKIETLKIIHSQAEVDLATAEQEVSNATDNSSKERAERRRDKAKSMLNKRARELVEAQEALNAAQKAPSLEEVQAELDKSKAILAEKENALKEAEQYQTELLKRSSRLRGLATGLREQNKEQKGTIASQGESIAQQTSTIAEQGATIAAHETELNSLRLVSKRNNELSQELAELKQGEPLLSKEDERALNSQLAGLRIENRERQEKITALNTQIEKMQSILDEVNNAVPEAKRSQETEENWSWIRTAFGKMQQEWINTKSLNKSLTQGLDAANLAATSANQEIERLKDEYEAEIVKLKVDHETELENQRKTINADKIEGLSQQVLLAQAEVEKAKRNQRHAIFLYGTTGGKLVTHQSGAQTVKDQGGIQLGATIANGYDPLLNTSGFLVDVEESSKALISEIERDLSIGKGSLSLSKEYQVRMERIIGETKSGASTPEYSYNDAIVATHQHLARIKVFSAQMDGLKETFAKASGELAVRFIEEYENAPEDKREETIGKYDKKFREYYKTARKQAKEALQKLMGSQALMLQGPVVLNPDNEYDNNAEKRKAILSNPLDINVNSYLSSLLDPPKNSPKKKEVVADPPRQGVLSRLTQRITGKSDTPLPVEAPPPPPVLTPPPVPPIALDDRVLDEYRRGIKAPKRNFEDLTIDDIITKTVQAPENFVREKIRKATHIDLRSYPADLSGNLLTRMSVEDPELPGNGYELIFEHERSKNAFGNRDGNILAGLFNGRFIIVESDLAEKIFKGTGDPNAPGLPDPSDPYDRRGQVKNRFNSVIKAVSLSQKQRYLDPEGTILVTDLQMRHLGMKGVSFDSYFSSFCRALTHV